MNRDAQIRENALIILAKKCQSMEAGYCPDWKALGKEKPCKEDIHFDCDKCFRNWAVLKATLELQEEKTTDDKWF